MCVPPTYIKQILSARSTIGNIHSILSIDQLPPPLIYYLDCVYLLSTVKSLNLVFGPNMCVLAFIKLQGRIIQSWDFMRYPDHQGVLNS